MMLRVLCALLAVLAVASSQSARGFEYVTCGSAFKLVHERTGFWLHSHRVTYGSGSDQNSVTLFFQPDDPNSLWAVGQRDPCNRGDKIRCGSLITLQHSNTRHFLHSENYQSPLSNNREVSCWGANTELDEGYEWEVQCPGQYWQRNDRIRLKHVQSDQFLHSTGSHQYQRPIPGQREVCAFEYANDFNYWTTKEGYYIKAAS
eukprot:m.40951 g.40951  ORF g.40951 m.40951 type:complete len:203 (-) comp46090_c0_seq1:83-691(-)